MVFMILHKAYTGFANVEFALMPQEDGLLGELRISTGFLQHKAYSKDHKYSTIFVHDIDIGSCECFKSEVRVVNDDGYEFWFRFQSEEDATIFYRMLKHKIELAQVEVPSDEEDYWEEGPWSVSDVELEPDEHCHCDCHYFHNG